VTDTLAAMRVLLVTGMYPTADRPGLGGFVRDQVESLRAMGGVEIELFAIEPGGSGRWLAAARELRRRYRGERFDVVHAHYGLAGWSALAVRGAPHLVTFHGTDLAHPVVGRMSRALARLIDLPAPVSTHLARLPGGGLPGAGADSPAAVLPMGVNLDRFGRRDRAEARARRGLDPARPYLLFPADPARPEKRHDRAQELARATGAELVGYEGVTPDQVPDLINAVNAVVTPSDREGYGLAPLEALACDVPVVSTDVGIAPSSRTWPPRIRGSRAASERSCSIATGWRSACSRSIESSRAPTPAANVSIQPMMAFRNRAADKARRAASGGAAPAGQDPQVPGEPVTATTADRGAMRKQIRHAREQRDLLLHELGALVMEMHRQGRHDPALVERKARGAIAADTELQTLTAALEQNRPAPPVAAPAAPAVPVAPPPVPSQLVSADAPPPSPADRVPGHDGVPTHTVSTPST
jgi:glycosyltransferase involved in cell wall biosynthesis